MTLNEYIFAERKQARESRDLALPRSDASKAAFLDGKVTAFNQLLQYLAQTKEKAFLNGHK